MFAKYRKPCEMLDGMLKLRVSSYHPDAFGSDQEEYYDPNPWPYQTVPEFPSLLYPRFKRKFSKFPNPFSKTESSEQIPRIRTAYRKECPFSYDPDDTKND